MKLFLNSFLPFSPSALADVCKHTHTHWVWSPYQCSPVLPQCTQQGAAYASDSLASAVISFSQNLSLCRQDVRHSWRLCLDTQINKHAANIEQHTPLTHSVSERKMAPCGSFISFLKWTYRSV